MTPENMATLTNAPRYDARHSLQDLGPRRQIGTLVRGAEEDHGVCRNVNGAAALEFGIAHVVGVEQCSLGDDAAQAVAHPDYWIPCRAGILSMCGQGHDEILGMLVDKVVGRRAVLLPHRDVGIITVDNYIRICVGIDEGRDEELDGPEDAIAGGPRMVGRAVEAVDEDDVGGGIRVGVHGCRLKPLDEFRADSLLHEHGQ